jgi:hypothetical protein
MRTAIRVCVALAAAALGCASGKATFNSSIDPTATPRLTRVFVMSRIKSAGFTEEVYSGFEKGMRAGFADCGVQTETMHVDEMDLDPGKRFEQAVRKFDPDAVLMIRHVSADVVASQHGSLDSDLIIDMQFVAYHENKPFWHAKSQLSIMTKNMYIDDEKSGLRFANATIERLRSDGLLKECKSPRA